MRESFECVILRWNQEKSKLTNEIEKQNKEVKETMQMVNILQKRVDEETAAHELEVSELSSSKKELASENDKLVEQLQEMQKAYYVLYNVSIQNESPVKSPVPASSPGRSHSSSRSPHNARSLRDFDF